MQILSVHLHDIKSHRDTELAFSSGINVLSGANGAGKSTVFEAIGYALFGVDARDFVSNVDRFISIGAKRGKISVIFQSDDADIWQVTRTVGAASKWILARKRGDSFEVEEHAGIAETEARIAGLLGLNNGRSLSEQFKLVIGPFQNDFLGPFIIRQATRRQEAFDEILGIDTWRKTFKGTASLLSLVQEKMKILDAEIQLLSQQVTILPDKEAEFNSAVGTLEVTRIVLAEREAALRDLEALLGDLESRAKAVTALSAEIQLLEGRIKDGGEKIARQKQIVDESQRAVSIVEASLAGKESFDKAELRLDDLRKKVLLRRSLEQDIARLDMQARLLQQSVELEEKEMVTADNEINLEEQQLAKTREELAAKAALLNSGLQLAELRLDAEHLRAERSLLEGRLASLVEGKDHLAEGVCPFFQEPCQNIEGVAPEDHFSLKITDINLAVAALDREIGEAAGKVADAEKVEKELHANRVRIQELDRQAATLDERRSRNRARFESLEHTKREYLLAASQVTIRQTELKLYQGLDAEIEHAEGERKRFQSDRDAYVAHLKDAEELDERTLTLAKWEEVLQNIQTELIGKNAELKLLAKQYDALKHKVLLAEKEHRLTEVATCRQQLEEIGRIIERLQKEIGELKRLQAIVAEKHAMIHSLAEKERLVKFLRNQVFRNVSAQLSERFREEISLRADRIYRTISESDEELLWGDNYQIILRDLKDGALRERSDDQLSGGQTMSAVVALRLALLQSIGARIAFFDEPTSNLDASRRENLAQAFRAIDVGREEVAEHWYDQLFLVSHDVAFTEITNQMIRIGE
jgi:exonuclease SbcC